MAFFHSGDFSPVFLFMSLAFGKTRGEGGSGMTRAQIPNCITALRILGAAVILVLPPFTILFYIVYTLCGVSDVVDGFLARRMGVTSELGSRLDSVADLLFYTGMVLRVFPALWQILPWQIWCGLGAVLLLRAGSYAAAGVKFRRFAAVHTYLNKLTGAAVFGVAYALVLPIGVPYCIVACAIGGLASLEELVIHLASPQYPAHVQSIFQLRGKPEKA